MPSEFLGHRFTPVTIDDLPRLGGVLARHPQPLSDYTLASLVVWAPVYGYGYTLVEPDTLLLCSFLGPGRAPRLLQPVGELPEALQQRLLARARDLPEPLRIESVSGAFLERHASFAAHFDAPRSETARTTSTPPPTSPSCREGSTRASAT
jgi:hypothetical protein